MVITADSVLNCCVVKFFFDELYKARVYMADATFERQLSSWLYVMDKEKHYVCREEL